MLKVQESLLGGGTLESLKEQYGINYRCHQKYPSLISFHYNQIDSPKGEEIVKECRGLVLDQSDDWHAVCFPFTRFYNHLEGHAAEIDWNSARCIEKYDGSCLSVYWNPYSQNWDVATSSTPDASGEVNGFGFTFKELFWRVWNQLGYRLPTSPALTYVFELMTPYNKVVVQHRSNRLVLIGARGLFSHKELDPLDVADLHKWEAPTCYNFNSVEDIVKMAADLDPIKSEGYVICDKYFRRIKLKSPAYVALHLLRDSMSRRRMLEIVRTNESAEFLRYWEEYTELHDQIKARLDQLVFDAEQLYEQHKNLVIQKDYAMAVKSSPLQGVLFSLRKGHISSVREGVQEMQIGALERIVGLKID